MEKFKKLNKTYQFLIITFALSFTVNFLFQIHYIFYLGFSGILFRLTEVFIWWLIMFIILFPFFYILSDKRIASEKKVGWFLLTLLFSWIAFAFYLIKNKE
tara:strand:+ start:61 stop:363 length:303 start_codon:yes stop_codon:yes gene_type:complete